MFVGELIERRLMEPVLSQDFSVLNIADILIYAILDIAVKCVSIDFVLHYLPLLRRGTFCLPVP